MAIGSSQTDFDTIANYIQDISHAVIIFDTTTQQIKIQSYFSLDMVHRHVCNQSDNAKAIARFYVASINMCYEKLLACLQKNTFYRIFTVHDSSLSYDDFYICYEYDIVDETSLEYNYCTNQFVKHMRNEKIRKPLSQEANSKISTKFNPLVEKYKPSSKIRSYLTDMLSTPSLLPKI